MRQREEIGTLNNYIQSNLDAEQISKQLIGSSKLETSLRVGWRKYSVDSIKSHLHVFVNEFTEHLELFLTTERRHMPLFAKNHIAVPKNPSDAIFLYFINIL